MMADQALTTVPAAATAAFITDSFDFDAGAGSQNLSVYVRDSTTTYCYTWAATGRTLTQVAAVSGACPT
jgi:hypothetical protein